MAWVDGDLVPVERAVVPLADEGLLRGDGVFEVVRIYGGRPFALAGHIARMEKGAAALRLPVSRAGEAVRALCPGFDGFVRVLVTRGPPPRTYALQEEPPPPPPLMRLATIAAPWLCPMGSSPLAGAKTLSYAANMAARRWAVEAGFDDALLISPAGVVLEGPTWTVMWVEDGGLHTPPLSLGILDSITRRAVMDIIDVVETQASLDRVLAADEVVVVSTAREGIGVASIDEHTWAGAPGPITSELGRRLTDHIRRSLA
jgi:branched-chain amino acid aminotransferase